MSCLPNYVVRFLISEIISVLWALSNTNFCIMSAVKYILSRANIYLHSNQLAIKLNSVNAIFPLAIITTGISCLFSMRYSLSDTCKESFYSFRPCICITCTGDWVIRIRRATDRQLRLRGLERERRCLETGPWLLFKVKAIKGRISKRWVTTAFTDQSNYATSGAPDIWTPNTSMGILQAVCPDSHGQS